MNTSLGMPEDDQGVARRQTTGPSPRFRISTPLSRPERLARAGDALPVKTSTRPIMLRTSGWPRFPESGAVRSAHRIPARLR